MKIVVEGDAVFPPVIALVIMTSQWAVSPSIGLARVRDV
jgi:hypothetical protein